MIRLRISDEAEAFRNECAEWLCAHPAPSTEGDPGLETFMRVGKLWQSQLAQARLVGVHWPEKYGGRGLSLVEEAIVQEELVRAGAPQLLGLFGLTMVGPVLIEHGTETQKLRYLPKILSGEEVWCQGFSEPGAGSDLAAIRTKAQVVDGGFVVNGQKTWTSFAHVAQWCFLLCRTSDEEKRHEGLTYLLVPMDAKGISTRPLKQISGDSEFNEVFFDNVFVPQEQIVGKVGDGWRIAIATLMFERVVLTFARQLQSETALRDLISRAEDSHDSTLRQRLVGELARLCAVRALAYEHLLAYARGRRPGPEGSMDKLFWSESFQAIARLGLAFEGEAAARGEEAAHRYLYSRGRTIAAGSSEIQRTIIAERILGLPRLSVTE